MLKRVVKDKDGNILENKQIEVPVENDKTKNKIKEKRKDTKNTVQPK